LATFGDPGWGKAEGKRRKIPEFIMVQGFQNFCLLPSALEPFSVLITKIGQEPY